MLKTVNVLPAGVNFEKGLILKRNKTTLQIIKASDSLGNSVIGAGAFMSVGSYLKSSEDYIFNGVRFKWDGQMFIVDLNNHKFEKSFLIAPVEGVFYLELNGPSPKLTSVFDKVIHNPEVKPVYELDDTIVKSRLYNHDDILALVQLIDDHMPELTNKDKFTLELSNGLEFNVWAKCYTYIKDINGKLIKKVTSNQYIVG